jgi:hypothetical protein
MSTMVLERTGALATLLGMTGDELDDYARALVSVRIEAARHVPIDAATLAAILVGTLCGSPDEAERHGPTLLAMQRATRPLAPSSRTCPLTGERTFGGAIAACIARVDLAAMIAQVSVAAELRMAQIEGFDHYGARVFSDWAEREDAAYPSRFRSIVLRGRAIKVLSDAFALPEGTE